MKFFIGLLFAMMFCGTSDIGLAQAESPLYQIQGLSRAFAKGGFAIVNDLSCLDLNPAGLSSDKDNKDYTVNAAVQWSEKKIASAEFGALDSTTSEISGGMKVRIINSPDKKKIYRYTMGLSEKLGYFPLDVGIAGDIDQVNKSNKDKNYSWRMRLGTIYSPIQEFHLAAFAGWDPKTKSMSPVQGLGLSWRINEFLLTSIDMHFLEFEPTAISSSLGLFFTQSLDLLLGYRYEKLLSTHNGAVELAIKAAMVRVYYSLTLDDIGHNHSMVHLLGISMSMAGLR